MMKKYTKDEWYVEGERLFGKERQEWKFRCPVCNYVQSLNDFLKNGVDKQKAHQMIAFSCLGRVVPGKGCDWTLGGFLQAHKAMMDDSPVFEFDGST
jgi:hypothetical protein